MRNYKLLRFGVGVLRAIEFTGRCLMVLMLAITSWALIDIIFFNWAGLRVTGVIPKIHCPECGAHFYEEES